MTTIEAKITLRQASASDFYCERKGKKHWYFGRCYTYSFMDPITEIFQLNERTDLEKFCNHLNNGEIFVPFSITKL